MSNLSWFPGARGESITRRCDVCGAFGVADDVDLERHIEWMHGGDPKPYSSVAVLNGVRADRVRFLLAAANEIEGLALGAMKLIRGARVAAELLSEHRSINEWAYTFSNLPKDIETLEDVAQFVKEVRAYAKDVENGTEPLGDYGWKDGAE